jgi:type III pantothenate kinase
MREVLAAIDAGNTNIAFGFFKAGKIFRKAVLPANAYSFARVKKLFSPLAIGDVIICSVAPSLTYIMTRDCRRIFGTSPALVGGDLSVPMKSRYRSPRTLGQDRLLGAWAGMKMFGAPLIVVDLGTAITVDIVSKSKEYSGGMILPGIGMSLASLYENTELLPRITLKRPAEFIGRDTSNSILSGAVYGFSALIEGLVKKIKMKAGRSAQVIGTGGDIALMSKYCAAFDVIEPDLVLKGLCLLHKTTGRGYA